MNNVAILAVLCTLMTFSVNSQGQARSVFGGSGKAKECYMNATLIADGIDASTRMLEPCTYALDYSTLDLKDRAATFTNRGVLQVALGRHEAALADYAASMNLIPDAGENYINRGNVHYQMADYQMALADYSMAIELDISQKHIAYFDRGMAHEKAGDLASAEEDYRTSLTFMPGWDLAQARLDRLLALEAEAAAASSNR